MCLLNFALSTRTTFGMVRHFVTHTYIMCVSYVSIYMYAHVICRYEECGKAGGQSTVKDKGTLISRTSG